MRLEDIVNLITEGRALEAREEAQALTQSDPSDVRAWIVDATICESLGDLEAERLAIAEGMRCDPRNYELFYMLGLMYAHSNVNQAYLCLEQAAHYCDNEEDLEEIQKRLQILRDNRALSVRPFSVIIVSFNDIELMQQNIASFRADVPRQAYEIVVVDNHSDDGVEKWLRQQSDIRLIENGENVGFPVGVNIGFRETDEEHDILLINNDCVPAVNAVFWLRMGLYEDKNVGAVSGVANNASTQEIREAPATLRECMEYGRKRNIPMKRPYEDRARFTAYVMMIRREACEAVREGEDLMDVRFSPAYFEDDDLGMRISTAGYRQLLCHNAFFYHRGGEGFMSQQKQDAMMEARERFIDKWGFDIWAYAETYDAFCDLVDESADRPIRVLECYCGMGINLSKIKYRHPYAYVAGIEPSAQVAGIGRHLADIVSGFPETITFPWPEETFDYIFLSDALTRAAHPEAFLEKVSRYLVPGGSLIYIRPDDELDSTRLRELTKQAGFTEREVLWDLVRIRK